MLSQTVWVNFASCDDLKIYQMREELLQSMWHTTYWWQSFSCVNTHLLKWCHKQAKHHIGDFIIKQLLENSGFHRLWLENNNNNMDNLKNKQKKKKQNIWPPTSPSTQRKYDQTRETISYLRDRNTCTFTQSPSGYIHWKVQICSSTCRNWAGTICIWNPFQIQPT